ARLRSYFRRAEPPARPRSEGSKVTSGDAVAGGRSTPRTVRGGPLVHGARAGRQVEPAEPARPGVAERHDLGARPLHCCQVSALPHTVVNQPTPAPVRARACTVISEILVPLWTQTLRHARGAREPPPRPPPHLPTASPVARAASSTEPRLVTSVNAAARMSSTAAPARFPDRHYTRHVGAGQSGGNAASGSPAVLSSMSAPSRCPLAHSSGVRTSIPTAPPTSRVLALAGSRVEHPAS